MSRLAAFVSAAACVAASSAIHAEIKPCLWTVASLRQPTEVEAGYAAADDCPESPGDSTAVRGSDSMAVFHKSDSAYHSFVYVKNLGTGSAERLIPESASLACRSPDGRYAACLVYKSPSLPWVLAVIDLASGKRMDPFPKAMTGRVKWSPDSRYLAAEKRHMDGSERAVFAMSFPEGEVSIIDTTATPGEYDFAWSPDSRWLAVARPAGSFHYGDYSLSELWLVSRSGDNRCCVVDAASWEELALVWFADREIFLERAFLREAEEETESEEGTVVIELNLDESVDSTQPVRR